MKKQNNLEAVISLLVFLGLFMFVISTATPVRAACTNGRAQAIYGAASCGQLLHINDVSIRTRFDHVAYITGAGRPDTSCSVCDEFGLTLGEHLLNLMNYFRIQPWNNLTPFTQGDMGALNEIINMMNRGDNNSFHQTSGYQFWYNWNQDLGFSTFNGSGNYAWTPNGYDTDWSRSGRGADNCPKWWHGGWGPATCPAPPGGGGGGSGGSGGGSSGGGGGSGGGTVTCLISRPITVSPEGTIYFTGGGQKRAFRTPETFFSYGYNFADAKFADPQDLALPDGPAMPFRDGTLIKSKDSPLVYLVSDGQKRGFVSSNVFLGLGYSFASVISAAAENFADLPLGPVIDKTNVAHPAGTLVNDNGTIFEITDNGRIGFVSELVFFNAGHQFNQVVPANDADRAMVQLSAEPASLNKCVPATSSAVTVASPNGGEQWPLASTQTIKWNDANSANQTYLLYLVQKGGNSLGFIGQVVNVTQYAWQVGKLVDGTIVQAGSGYYVIVAKNTGTGALSDQSDNSFTITGPNQINY